ncbi:MAG: protein kinase domain-containing protein [Oscillochloridaceae bacterium umkhey_bin13]
MRQTCLICARSAPDGKLFCQDVRCQAEMAPRILDYGEWLGDLEITRPIVILPSAVLYEACRQGEKLLLKVAHPGQEHTQRLEREAHLLQQMQRKGQAPAYMPTLRPPYTNLALNESPYGRMALGKQLLYFCVFEHFVGEPLADHLLKHPQPWLFHVGWIATALATAVATMHSHRRLHLALSPQSALVRFDQERNAPEVLLIDLGVVWDAGEPQHFQRDWYPDVVAPDYTAPELAPPVNGPPGYPADVYGLGLISYEMLAGHPALGTSQTHQNAAANATPTRRIAPLSRAQDAAKVATLVERMLSAHPIDRHPSAEPLAHELLALFGTPPPAPRRWLPSGETAMQIAVVILIIAFATALIASLLSLYGVGTGLVL